jgi:selenide,water dikinase
VDFFTPVVDDPGAYGEIAAANALSDVFAMGGRPITALSIACFPDTGFPLDWARAIVEGGARKLQEAGCVLLGGHSVRDPEIKFGYAITGLVDPERLLTNAAGRPGDVLVLTKPLGTGVIATALKAGQAPAAAVQAATRSRESGLTLEIEAALLPLLPHALELAPGFASSGLRANERQFGPGTALPGSLDPALSALLYDPQTSGGLFLLVPEGAQSALLEDLPGAVRIGVARTRGAAAIVVR